MIVDAMKEEVPVHPVASMSVSIQLTADEEGHEAAHQVEGYGHEELDYERSCHRIHPSNRPNRVPRIDLQLHTSLRGSVSSR